MKKYLTAILTAAGSALGAAAVPLYFRWRAHRNAKESRPKIEALLDEMIRLATAHKGSLDRVVGTNETKTVNDETRDRDLSLHVGDTCYMLDVVTKLVGRKAGRVTVRLYRSRGDTRLHVYWPDTGEYWPMEAWLKERLDRLDALVGTASRRGRVDRVISSLESRLGIGGNDDDDGGSTTN